MKIGTITFHGSHNYGSALQAYALQEYIKELMKDHQIPCDYQIMNYRSVLQKKMYQSPSPGSIKDTIKWFMHLPYKSLLDTQSRKFEDFIAGYLQTTEEFSSPDHLCDIVSSYDVLIAGSDQIWNVRARDFDYAYLLPGCSKKKISYAASLGPLPFDWKGYDAQKYADLLNSFSMISVREESSREMIRDFLGDKKVEILPDPVFLLDLKDWRKIQSSMNPGKYILFYCLEPSKEHIRIAELLSRTMNLPVVSTRYRNRNDYLNPFIKQYDAGPCDFLSLIDHAAVVLTSSFHGTAFSLIYEKPFIVINGMEDGRIRNILKQFDGERNDLRFGTNMLREPYAITNAASIIENEQGKAKSYLEKALGLNK